MHTVIDEPVEWKCNGKEKREETIPAGEYCAQDEEGKRMLEIWGKDCCMVCACSWSVQMKRASKRKLLERKSQKIDY